jgi:hypothetical protein
VKLRLFAFSCREQEYHACYSCHILDRVGSRIRLWTAAFPSSAEMSASCRRPWSSCCCPSSSEVFECAQIDFSAAPRGCLGVWATFRPSVQVPTGIRIRNNVERSEIRPSSHQSFSKETNDSTKVELIGGWLSNGLWLEEDFGRIVRGNWFVTHIYQFKSYMQDRFQTSFVSVQSAMSHN